mmetsp:Transcript_11793/g.26719  ORF Transcript_11793/g.26719 Transcript_11793/m.26719 type:complete len:492 (+) Transcript_11793:141-1616(+)
MPREVICVHIGQAGCQLGNQLWELFCCEHDILPDGTKENDESVGVGEEPFNAFFSETMSGQHVPRAIFIDTDPSTKEDLESSKFGKLFKKDNVIGYKEDAKSNYFEGRMMAHTYKITETVVERVRKEADICTNLQGFFVFHAFGGGTGSGVGVDVLDRLHDEFQRKMIFQPLVFPSRDYTTSVVEPYNCIFATHHTRETVHLSMVLDNQAAYNMCINHLKIANPHFFDLNRIISQVVSACTTSLRYQSELNASLEEIVVNLVPSPTFRYPILSLAPIRPAAQKAHENFLTRELVQELFEPGSVLCDCGNHLRMNRYLAAVVLLRGEADPKKDEAPRGAQGPLPLQVNDAYQALQSLINPSGSYRKPIMFLPWVEGGGFKVGVVGARAILPDPTFMAASDRQGAMLGNSTAVRNLFVGQYRRFLKLFYHKAYVWQFLQASGEEDMFEEAKQTVRDLIDSYEELLQKCVEVEKTQGNSKRTLKGATSASNRAT